MPYPEPDDLNLRKAKSTFQYKRSQWTVIKAKLPSTTNSPPTFLPPHEPPLRKPPAASRQHPRGQTRSRDDHLSERRFRTIQPAPTPQTVARNQGMNEIPMTCRYPLNTLPGLQSWITCCCRWISSQLAHRFSTIIVCFIQLSTRTLMTAFRKIPNPRAATEAIPSPLHYHPRTMLRMRRGVSAIMESRQPVAAGATAVPTTHRAREGQAVVLGAMRGCVRERNQIL